MHEVVIVSFKGIEYDVRDWLKEHPGGRQVILNYINFDKNITEVFKYSFSYQIISLQISWKKVARAS